MLHKIHKTKETGFTLIELLTVIIIIGILAAVAIPVFTSQRGRAQDSQTMSDVRNIVTSAETYLADRTKTVDTLSQSNVEYTSSKNVLWNIKGNATTNGYCIAAYNKSGKVYNSSTSLLTYDSTAGGLKQSGGSCAGAGNTPTPTTSTGAGATSPTGATIVAAPATLTNTTAASPFAASNEDQIRQITYDSVGATVYAADQGGTNVGIRKMNLNGSTSMLNTERPYIGVTKVGDRLYATPNDNSGVIYEINTTTGASTSRATLSGYLENLTTDGTYLYVANSSNGEVVRYTVNPDGTLTNRFSFWSGIAGYVQSITVDSTGTTLYMSNNSGVLKSKSIADGTVTDIANLGANVTALAWASNNSLYYGSTSSANVIKNVNISTKNITNAATISTGTSNWLPGLTSDGTYLYVTAYSTSGGSPGIYKF